MTSKHPDASDFTRSDQQTVGLTRAEKTLTTKGEDLIEMIAKLVDPSAMRSLADLQERRQEQFDRLPPKSVPPSYPERRAKEDYSFLSDRRQAALDKAKAIHALYADALQALIDKGNKDLESARVQSDRLCGAPEEPSAGKYKALPTRDTTGFYRKRPVTIEACRFDNRITNQPPLWLWQAVDRGEVAYHPRPDMHLMIKTLEGGMRANEGDWIIKGTKGELYPCKPDVFEEVYEAVE